MRARLKVYTNSDDALLQWTVDALADNTIGFAIERKLKRDGYQQGPDWLSNYSPPGPAGHQLAAFQPSSVWPFRCFSWTDHEVDVGNQVSYRVVPVVGGAPTVDYDAASAWSPIVTVGARSKTAHSAYFNRGFVISQFMSRWLDEHYPGLERSGALRLFKRDIGSHVENEMRRMLSGQLRVAMLDLLDGVRRGKEHVYAALFELGDDELIDRLVRLGRRAHLVLANGAIEARKGETAAQARTRDENKDARDLLIRAGADVQADARFVSPGALAHNKFLVVTDAAGKAKRVWTGSTNWTPTGLCTQLNNGLLVNDAAVAALYLQQWHELRTAGSTHPRVLTTANSTPGVAGKSSVQFTRAADRVDLDELGKIVAGAKDGLLFLMFIPGPSGAFADVEKLAGGGGKLVRGVVSQLPKGRQDEQSGPKTTVRITLAGAPGSIPRTQKYDVVQPRGMAHVAAGWAAETTREQFLGSIGHAIIHSKVLVVDPFSDDPTVVTGSHNFSKSASGTNDENFIVIRGDKALAEAYAVNIESAWRHYAGRAGNPYPRLRGIEYLRALWRDQRANEHFWRL